MHRVEAIKLTAVAWPPRSERSIHPGLSVSESPPLFCSVLPDTHQPFGPMLEMKSGRHLCLQSMPLKETQLQSEGSSFRLGLEP